jgi:hypothetical protein
MSLTIQNKIIYAIFNFAEESLYSLADILNISYELLNIIIFLVAYPALIIILLFIIKSQRKKIWLLEKGKLQYFRIK